MPSRALFEIRFLKSQISKRDFKYFPTLNKYYHENTSFDSQRYVKRIGKLIHKFETRFSDIQKLKKTFDFAKNPMFVLFSTQKSYVHF